MRAERQHKGKNEFVYISIEIERYKHINSINEFSCKITCIGRCEIQILDAKIIIPRFFVEKKPDELQVAIKRKEHITNFKFICGIQLSQIKVEFHLITPNLPYY